ncbi:MAG: 7-cyano-7-deazaguanine synthase [Armatimonadota bacterium]|jgi:7-cyano-7-deazaguanine synthase in queuosine biosynthesis
MPARVAVTHGPLPTHDAARGADLLIAWEGDRANVSADLSALRCSGGHCPLSPAAQDLLDLAVALYAADIAVRRGERESWPREIDLAMPVREPELWAEARDDLHRLIYELSRDSFRLHFSPGECVPTPAGETARPQADIEPDCVSMLSGGLDSLAGAVVLQEAGRRPLYSLHRSGNPAVRAAQESVLAAIEAHWPGRSAALPCTVEPDPRGGAALPYPPAEEREPSRRLRSLLFMALALVTAEAAGVDEVYMPENGVLTAGLPLAASRAGSMSTHSTHPAALELMNAIAGRAGLRGRLLNPFVYQTKAELIRDVLAPRLSIAEIQCTVSCWAVGRANRPCGGCIPCLLRQLGMVWAELPAEAHLLDLLTRPDDYVGTDAYGNLVDVLRQAEQTSRRTEAEIVASQPELLSLHSAGLDVGEVVAMLKHHADQTLTVVERRYPAAARLI